MLQLVRVSVSYIEVLLGCDDLYGESPRLLPAVMHVAESCKEASTREDIYEWAVYEHYDLPARQSC